MGGRSGRLSARRRFAAISQTRAVESGPSERLHAGREMDNVCGAVAMGPSTSQPWQAGRTVPSAGGRGRRP